MAEPHTGTPQVGGDACERPSRKTRPVKIPAWVPYTGQTPAGSFLSARRKGPPHPPSLPMLETGSSQIVTEPIRSRRPWTPKPGVGTYSRSFCRLIVHVHTEIEDFTRKCTHTPTSKS
jgi:hypothetical protein